MKSLRILFTRECYRSCKNCVNDQWDLDSLPEIENPAYRDQRSFFQSFDEIILTGGEPLLYPGDLLTTTYHLKQQAPDSKIILYTAWDGEEDLLYPLFDYIDGLTYTIHERKDVEHFLDIAYLYWFYYHSKELKPEHSLRVNIFGGIDLPEVDEAGYGVSPLYDQWGIKKGLEFIEDCPLPSNETFIRITGV